MTSTTKSNLSLTEDQIDDLLYHARTGETEEFTTLQKELCGKEYGIADLLDAAIDEGSGNGVLHMCAANGHAELLWTTTKSLLNSPAILPLVNRQNRSGNTALHWAALNGHLEAVQKLLELGADPTVENQKGHDAVYEAELADRTEIVEWVLKMCEGLQTGVGGEGGEDVRDVDEEAEGEGDGEGNGDRQMVDGDEGCSPINSLSMKLADQVQKMELDEREGQDECGVKNRK